MKELLGNLSDDSHAMPILSDKKKAGQTRVHSSKSPIPCKGSNCTIEFYPKRRDQLFCSRECRLKYFSIARDLGSVLLRKSNTSPKWKAIADELQEELRGKAEDRILQENG